MRPPEKTHPARDADSQITGELARKDQDMRAGRGGLGSVVGTPPVSGGTVKSNPLASGNEVFANLPAGQTAPAANPQADQAGGGGILTTAEAVQGNLAAGPRPGTQLSEEAKNQLDTGRKNRAESGTP